MMLLKTDHLEIFYFKSECLVEARWFGSPTSEEYRQGLTSYLNIITNYEVKYWLDDYQMVTGIDKDASEWAKKKWLPEFNKIACLKLERMARVITSKRFKEANSKNITQVPTATSFPFLNQEFQNYNLAFCWLTGKFFIIDENIGIAV